MTSRKFLFAIFTTLLGFGLVLHGDVSGDSYLTFVGVVGATFIIGNVGTKAVDMMTQEKID